MESVPDNPLNIDPERQADSLFRGCEYQVWQTVSSWVDLSFDEILYVEGAEDFDVVNPIGATAVQIKEGEEKISLGRADVIDALNNFWKSYKKSPTKNIKFRFLTRGEFSVEKGAPFGTKTKGLDIWSRRNISDFEVQQIVSFVAADSRIIPEFASWMKSSRPDVIRSELLSRVSWESGADAVEEVERSVSRKLVRISRSPRNIQLSWPTPTLERISLGLYSEVWKVLRKRDGSIRYLDVFRFEKVWEECSRVSIHQPALDVLLSQVSTQNNFIEQIRFGPPPLPEGIVHRDKFVLELRTLLDLKLFVNIHGSTRMGKTTLAKLVISTEPNAWIWSSQSRRSIEESVRSLEFLASKISLDRGGYSLVLDDLDFSPTSAAAIEPILGEILALVRGRKGRVVITGQKPLPPRFRHAFTISNEQIILIPKLGSNEIIELASALGCPQDNRLQVWSGLAQILTKGHPQLCAVYLSAAANLGWPDKPDGAMGSSEVDMERADARQLLDVLPEQQRTLLYRLSVFPRWFRRDHAIRCVSLPPPLVGTNELFNSLVGPWIEPLHGGYFALSPLIESCARDVYGANDVRVLEDQLAWILVNVEPRTTIEGAMAFQLLWNTANGGALLGLIGGFNELDDPDFASLADNLSWLVYLHLEASRPLFPSDANVSCALRMFQYRVAKAIDLESASRVFSAWRNEVPAKSDINNLVLITVSVLPYYQVPISPKEFVDLFVDFQAVCLAHPEIVNDIPSELFSNSFLPKTDDPVITLGYSISQRFTDIKFLEGFLEEVAKVSTEMRNKILLSLHGSGCECQHAIDNIWLNEADIKTPNWENCILVLERAFELGKTWSFLDLSYSSLRALAVICEEYLHDPSRAFSIIQRLGDDVGKNHIVYDRLASVYFSQGEFDKAGENWALALKMWPKPVAPHDRHGAFAARAAAISAAKLGRWELAAKLFLEVPSRLPVVDDNITNSFAAGGYADAAYSYWKAGFSKESILASIDAWKKADCLPDGRTDQRAFQVRKLAGSVIAWIHEQVFNPESKQAEPLAGMCSSVEMPEKIRELPENDNFGVWLFVIRLERVLQVGDEASRKLPEVLAASKSGTRSLGYGEVLSQMLVKGDVSTLPRHIVNLAQALLAAAIDYKSATGFPSINTSFHPEEFQKDDAVLGASVFLAALIDAGARNQKWSELIECWRQQVINFQDSAIWNDWFKEIESVDRLTLGQLGTLLRDSNARWTGRMLAGTKLISEGCDPNTLFYSHACFLIEMPTSSWLSDVSSHFSTLVERAWLTVALQPTILSPLRLTVIVSACMEDKPNLNKAIKILEAARLAVTINVNEEIWSKIQALKRAWLN